MRDGIGAEDDVDVVKILEQALTVALRDAAADGYDTSTGWAQEDFCKRSTGRTGAYLQPRGRSTS